MLVKDCPACSGNGEVQVGSHAFPRFGVLAMATDCHLCGGAGKLKPKTILRKKGSLCINRNLRPIVTRENVNYVLGLDVLTVE